MKFISYIYISAFAVFALIACNNSGKSGGDNVSGVEVNPSNNQSQDSILASLNAMIAADPKNYMNYLNRAKYFGELNNFVAAMDDINRALAIDSAQSDIYLFKGQLLFKRESVAEAYEEYRNCLRYNPLNEQCLLNKAGIDIVLGNYSLAREEINDALKVNEFNPYAYYLRGRMYKAMGDTTLAASSYKTAIEVDPNYYDAYVEVGLLYAAQKNELAKEYYSSAIQVKPRSIEAWYNKAMFLQETGYKKKERYLEAMTCYDSILKIDSRFAAAEFNKGFIWLEFLANYDSSAFYFTQAISKLPQYHQAYYNRGLSYESLGKKSQAEQDYRAALAIKPDYTEAALALNRLLK